ncbi:zonular occludens toxin domain-containing protein [Acinetobacter baumannii]|nr:zonular occludens toxin domain-containing protein [Acinetobacter baumannii]
MLTLISATPGSGKTLKSIELIFEYLNKGYVVFTNIIGLKIPGVISIPTNQDWRDLDHFRRSNPEMSKMPIAVFYDEAHEHPAFAEKNLIKDKEKLEEVRDIGYSLSMHRHFGFDIFLITQSPKKLAPYVLADVGCHLYLRRVYKMKRATIYEFPEAHALVSKSTRDDAVNKTIWKFPKQLYQYYTSTEIDTHKGGIPLKYLLVIFIVFICIPAYVARSFWLDPLFGHKNEETEIVYDKPKTNEPVKSQPVFSSTQKTDPMEQLKQEEEKRVAMVIESNDDCYARNSYGQIINMNVNDCRILSRKNSRMETSRYKKEIYKDGLPNSHYNEISHENQMTLNQTSDSSSMVSYKAPNYS